MNPNPTTFTDLPTGLSNLMGAYDDGPLANRRSAKSKRVSASSRAELCWQQAPAADVGKLVKLDSRNRSASLRHSARRSSRHERRLLGRIASRAAIAKAGSFRGAALIVPTGVDAGLIAVALRGRGIFVEGPITVPAAAAVLEEESESEREDRRAEDEERRRQREEEERRRKR